MMKDKVKKYIIRLSAAVLIHFMIKVFDQTFAGKLFVFDLRGTSFLIFFVIFVLIMWETGDLIYRFSLNTLLKRFDIIRQASSLLMIFIVYGVIVIVLFTISYSLFDLIFFDLQHYGSAYRFFDLDANVGMFIGYLGVLIFIGQVYAYNHWKKERLVSEQLQKENFQARFEALKNQVDPHFFFNNMSVLTRLVYKNQDLAAEYINQLSKIYRYILDKRDEMLVPLKEELAFLDSYFFLIKIRHEEHILFRTNLDEKTTRECYLPPNTLQLLIENAIKHNQFSDSEPLNITISEDDGFLIIKNSLKRRKLIEETSKLGLENIRKRYALLSDSRVEVNEGGAEFTVLLPKLFKETYESTDIRG
ncbi:MAG: histidine kinase [Bacteroidales bacterium]|nr:histidine kinase [Bacteroidales bacterium]